MAKTEDITQIITEVGIDLQAIQELLNKDKEFDSNNLKQLVSKIKIINIHNEEVVNKQIPDLNSFTLGQAYFKAAKDLSKMEQDLLMLKKPADIKEYFAGNAQIAIDAIGKLKMIYKKLAVIDDEGGLF